jgi:hypothetical protein
MGHPFTSKWASRQKSEQGVLRNLPLSQEVKHIIANLKGTK